MNSQVNVRMSNELLSKSQKMSEKLGFSSLQEFIRETVREKVFEDAEVLTRREYKQLDRMLKIADKSGFVGEDEFLKALDEK